MQNECGGHRGKQQQQRRPHLLQLVGLEPCHTVCQLPRSLGTTAVSLPLLYRLNLPLYHYSQLSLAATRGTCGSSPSPPCATCPTKQNSAPFTIPQARLPPWLAAAVHSSTVSTLKTKLPLHPSLTQYTCRLSSRHVDMWCQ